MKTDLPTLMQAGNLDALIVLGDAFHNPAMVYFTGVAHVSGALLVVKRDQQPLLFCHAMEREEAAATGIPTRSITDYDYRAIFAESGKDPLRANAQLFQMMLKDAGVTSGRVAVYGQNDAGRAHALLSALEENMPQVEFAAEFHKSTLMQARMTKDTAEVERMRNIARQTTEVVGQVAEFLSSQRAKNDILVDKKGEAITVGTVKSKINLWLAERGLEYPEGTIFAPGREGSVPHNMGNPASPLRLGVPIVFDIFPIEAGGGFFADFTRTWCLGHASDEAQELYADVRFVYETIMTELKPDTRCIDIQGRACQLFAERGHATMAENPATKEGFVHGLAHGLGLDVHEPPTFGRGATEEDILQRNMVVTIEPGLYYPERGLGTRIEDAVYMRPDGKSEILAPYPLDLVIPVKS